MKGEYWVQQYKRGMNRTPQHGEPRMHRTHSVQTVAIKLEGESSKEQLLDVVTVEMEGSVAIETEQCSDEDGQ